MRKEKKNYENEMSKNCELSPHTKYILTYTVRIQYSADKY